ncbi:Fic family protein [Neoactinobaculum massilliense]|uniref:Fic family protein n=1 Tax=Neoactinobaculum massilliense TaxID=2364794 RepID=UPI000F521DF0|nr:Fic family protein [Neoactinobaculum massilliense]
MPDSQYQADAPTNAAPTPADGVGTSAAHYSPSHVPIAPTGVVRTSEPYEFLRKLRYVDADGGKAAYERRIGAPGTRRIKIPGHSMFYVPLPQTEAAVEEIYARERTINATWRTLPPVATTSFIQSLIIHEVISTNNIEGVHSTRREVQEALAKPNVRLSSFVRLFLELTGDHPARIATLEDIRAVYNRVTEGEISRDDLPDGQLFRKEPVLITTGSQKIVHRGVYPEANIRAGLETMLGLWKRPISSRLVAATLSHLLFEMIHPFYDGNGRTGRYLLAHALRQTLSISTALAVSPQISDDKEAYYRAFIEVEDARNRGECTQFVTTMLDFIGRAQRWVLGTIGPKSTSLARAHELLQHLAPTIRSKAERNTLFVLAQAYLFAEDHATDLDTFVATYGSSRRTFRDALRELEEQGRVVTVRRRPLRFALSTAEAERLTLDVD